MNLSFSIRWISGGVVFLVETDIPTETFMYPKRSVSVERDLHVTWEVWAGVETQKNVRREIGGWGRVPFNEPYAPSLSTIYDGA